MKKHLLIGVSGGIAAYKTCDLVSKLTQKDYEVKVIMTEAACRFVGPLTFEALSKNKTYLDSDRMYEGKISHIELADWADLILVAPASANTIAKIAHGFADNLLCETVLATTAPVVLAPAMNSNMLASPVTKQNIQKAKELGMIILDSDSGHLACGVTGPGRLPDTPSLIASIESVLYSQDSNSNETGDQKEAAELPLKGLKVLVSAGPTREAIDPVRYITNHSTGKQGYAVAKKARDLGAEVTLVSGPVSLEKPEDIRVIDVESAIAMKEALEENLKNHDFLVMSAAVADYRPEKAADSKIKKSEDQLNLTLVKNPDILKGLSEMKKDHIFCGFAMETEDLEKNAKKKLHEKNLDLIVANSLRDPGAGFAGDTNIVTIYSPHDEQSYPILSKEEVAEKILDKMLSIYQNRQKGN